MSSFYGRFHHIWQRDALINGWHGIDNEYMYYIHVHVHVHLFFGVTNNVNTSTTKAREESRSVGRYRAMRATYEWQTLHGIWLSSKIRISYLPLVYLSTLLFRALMKMFAFFCFSLTKTIILANIIICKRFKNEWRICSLKRSANNHWFQWFWLRTADVFGNATNANFIKYKWPVKSAHNFFSPVNTHTLVFWIA